MPRKPARRLYGSGAVTWVTSSKVKLRVRVDGVTHSKTVDVSHRDHGGRGEADGVLAAFKAEVASGVAVVPVVRSLHTLGEVLSSYIELCQGSTRPGTIESYENAAKRVPEDLKAKEVRDVSAHDLDSLFSSLRTEGYAPSTVKATHAVLRAAIGQAQRWGWVGANPAAATRPLRDNGAEKRTATPAEVRKLIMLAAAPKAAGGMEDMVLASFILMAAVTGCRRGELCGLKWGDLDPETLSLRVERQLVPAKGGQHEAPPKSKGGTRTVYLDREVFDFLEAYRTEQRVVLEREPRGWLLSYDAGTTPLRAKAVGESISRLAREADLAGITSHSFRRMTGTELAAAGVDAAAAAARLGHTIEVMHSHYVRPVNDREVAAAAQYNERLRDRGLGIAEIAAALSHSEPQ